MSSIIYYTDFKTVKSVSTHEDVIAQLKLGYWIQDGNHFYRLSVIDETLLRVYESEKGFVIFKKENFLSKFAFVDRTRYVLTLNKKDESKGELEGLLFSDLILHKSIDSPEDSWHNLRCGYLIGADDNIDDDLFQLDDDKVYRYSVVDGKLVYTRYYLKSDFKLSHSSPRSVFRIKTLADKMISKEYQMITNNKTKETKTMKESIVNYLKQNKNVIITVILVLMVDKFIFKGAFTNRLKSIVDKFLGNAEKSLDAPKE